MARQDLSELVDGIKTSYAPPRMQVAVLHQAPETVHEGLVFFGHAQ